MKFRERLAARKISLMTLLAVTTTGLLGLTVAFVIFTSASANLHNTIDLALDSAEQVVDTIETRIRTHMAAAENIITHLAERVESGRLDVSNKDALARYMTGAMAPAPQIAGILVWDKSLNQVIVERGPSDAVNLSILRERDKSQFGFILRELMRTGQHWWGPPYLDENSGKTYLIVWGPLTRKGRVQGMVAAGITISELSDFLQSTTSNWKGTAFALYGKDHVLAHPSFISNKVGRRKHDDNDPLPQLKGFSDKVVAGYFLHRMVRHDRKVAVDVRRAKTGDEDHVVLSRKITRFGETPWIIGAYFPEGRFSEQFLRLYISIGIGIALLLVSGLLAVYVARSISKPISRLAGVARQVGDMELGDIPRLKDSRLSEIDTQSRAFNTMLEGLRQFETYVPKRLVQNLMSSGRQAGDLREAELSVMFVDIVGFTARSEKMAPPQLAEFINRHITLVNSCIEATGGTVDKYVGDAVMAFWGAPEHQPDHAVRACRAALDISHKLAELGDEAARVKIAIHTGPLVVGNIGAPGRINYTVLGDTVNTCARIESLGSQLDKGDAAIILVSEATKQQLGDEFTLQTAGSFAVKGKAQEVKIFRLTGSVAAKG